MGYQRVTFQFHSHPLALNAELLPILPLGAKLSWDNPVDELHFRRTRGQFSIGDDTGLLGETSEWGRAVRLAENQLDLLLARHSLPNRLFLHAGAVEVAGKVWLFPGGSGFGKSTLVWQLLEEGATYISGDFSILDADHQVWALARPLSLRQQGRHLEYRPNRWNLGPLPLGGILFTHYQQNALFQPQPLRAAQAAIELLPHLPLSNRDLAHPLQFLAPLLERVPLWKGIRGEALEVAKWLIAQSKS